MATFMEAEERMLGPKIKIGVWFDKVHSLELGLHEGEVKVNAKQVTAWSQKIRKDRCEWKAASLYKWERIPVILIHSDSYWIGLKQKAEKA